MLYLLDSLEVVTVDEQGHFAMLHAHLASWLDGLALGHISPEASVAMRDEFRSRLQLLGCLDLAGRPTGVTCSASAIWDEFGEAMSVVGSQDCVDCGRMG